MRHSFEHPLPSRIFALEVIRGAPVIHDFLAGELRSWVEERSGVIRAWAGQGRMAAVEPVHLFFTIWAATQTYADFDAQITAVLGREQTAGDRELATEQLVGLLLRGCGLRP
jgi:TetR/AcrR family transcriptional regulator